MQYPDNKEITPSTIPLLQGTSEKYKATLDSFLSFVHSRKYPRQKTYTKAELRALTPQHVLWWWMNLKAFGVIDPPNDANPTFARSISLSFWKKPSHTFCQIA
jgi:hypothetical protein